MNIQEHNKNILPLTGKVNAFLKKLGIWIICLEKPNFDELTLTSNYIDKKYEVRKSCC